ncbi:tyrosine-protein phosphatase non-receptor type substrate 1-like [Rana temporaria]|uniref:tyrosine-protein phosphatase non-receptor type substrate 1-like n=1 Tax=Rana temporaria TaxID=8407 RepID=UPI001AACAD1D|nr:tyrosine-protein phosphatase non-receptor type substrate 1-like [Rana temporaria]
MNGRIVWLFHLLCFTGAALQMTGPSTYKARVGSIAHIPCTFTAHKLPADPKYFAVIWNLEGKHILSYDNIVTSTDPRYSLDKDRALNGSAHLTISNTFPSDGGIYTCSVIDSPVRREKEIRVKISGAALQMTGPFTYEARVGSIAHIPCTFKADKLPANPKYFAIFWYLKGKHILSYDNTVIPTDPRYSLDKDRALNGNASLTISNPSVSDGGLYTCSVNYSSFLMKRKISMTLSARPLLSMLGSVQRNRENTLTCMANRYFPNDINVTWYKDGKVLKNQSMGEPLQYDNGTYQVNSTAKITPSDDDRNKTFSCRIQHVSLQEPLQEDFQLSYEGTNNQEFQSESSSHVVIIIGIVIAVVLIIGIIAAVILCRQKRKRKGQAFGVCPLLQCPSSTDESIV